MKPTNIQAAKAAGAKFYNTGKPCKYGHYADRHASNGVCVGCRQAEIKGTSKKKGPIRPPDGVHNLKMMAN